MNEESFKIRAYYKTELAMLYNPGQCITVALQTLSRWIHSNPALLEELTNAHYNKFRRMYTPREVAMIVKHLGEP